MAKPHRGTTAGALSRTKSGAIFDRPADARVFGNPPYMRILEHFALDGWVRSEKYIAPPKSRKECILSVNDLNIATTDAQKLYEELKPYIRKVARRFVGINGAELDDIMQESFFAVTSARESYDPAQGEFAAYFCTVLNRRLRRYINGSLNIPEYMHQSLAKLNAAEDEIRKTGREPRESELCFVLGITEESLKNLFQCREALKVKSLDAPLTDETEATFFEIIPDETDEMTETEHRTDHARMAAELWKEIEAEGTTEIMRGRYIDEKSTLQISKETGASYNKIQRAEKNTLRKLKKNKTLLLYYDQYISGLYRLGGLNRFRTTGFSEVEEIAIRRAEG